MTLPGKTGVQCVLLANLAVETIFSFLVQSSKGTHCKQQAVVASLVQDARSPDFKEGYQVAHVRCGTRHSLDLSLHTKMAKLWIDLAAFACVRVCPQTSLCTAP